MPPVPTPEILKGKPGGQPPSHIEWLNKAWQDPNGDQWTTNGLIFQGFLDLKDLPPKVPNQSKEMGQFHPCFLNEEVIGGWGVKVNKLLLEDH